MTFYLPTYEKKICMQKGENDVEKLIKKVTLKMIEKENVWNFLFYFFFK